MGRYWLMRQPFWVRGLVVGTPFGVTMFILMRLFEDGWWGVAGGLGNGLLFGFLYTGLTDQQSRRILRADGEPLTTDQLVEVSRAADAGRWPPNPHLHQPVEQLARQRLRPSGSLWAVAAILSASIGYAVFRAVTHDPIWWTFAGGMAPVAIWALARTSRQRHAARRLMDQLAPAEVRRPR
jgi:hypothetical protein